MQVRKQAGPSPDLPEVPGSYLLVARLAAPVRLRAGALGEFHFPPGAYVYCGSALGPGGIGARAGRHWRGGAARWHIDFLLRHAVIEAVWTRAGAIRLECRWAAALGKSGGFDAPAPRFGASDCRCPSHLWHAGTGTAELEAALRRLPWAPRRLWRRGGGTDMLENA